MDSDIGESSLDADKKYLTWFSCEKPMVMMEGFFQIMHHLSTGLVLKNMELSTARLKLICNLWQHGNEGMKFSDSTGAESQSGRCLSMYHFIAWAAEEMKIQRPGMERILAKEKSWNSADIYFAAISKCTEFKCFFVLTRVATGTWLLFSKREEQPFIV